MQIVEIEDAEVFCGLLRNMRNSQPEGVRGSVDLYRPEWYDERRARMWSAIHTVNGTPEVFAVAAVLSNRELVSICARPNAVQRTLREKDLNVYRYYYSDMVMRRRRAEEKGGAKFWRVHPFRRAIVSAAWEARKSYHKHLF